MSTGKYILDGCRPVPENDILRWAQWFETAKRHVAEDLVGHLRVSTVFIGIDHSFGRGEPLLFETMVFSGGHSVMGIQERYATWDDAVVGHAEVLARVIAASGSGSAESEKEHGT